MADHHHNQNMKHFYHSKKFSHAPLWRIRSLYLQALATVNQINVPVVFLEYHINEIVQYVFFGVFFHLS